MTGADAPPDLPANWPPPAVAGSDHHVAELAMAARLLLVPPAHFDALADRLLVGDEARLALDRDAVFALQPLGCHPQVHLALAQQQHLMRVLVHLEPQRGVLLHQLGECRCQLHLVLAVLQA
jgi:hypothetical protein